MKTAGIDACEVGWLLVSFDDGNHFSLLRDEQLLAEAFDAFDRIFINLPLGLSEDAPIRRCDQLLIDKLGPEAGGEITPPPIRPVLSAPTYAEANIMSFELTGRELPVKTWSMVPRIRSVNKLLEESGSRRGKILESHPELLLMDLNGGRIYQNRQTKKGLNHRLDLIGSLQTGTGDTYRAIKEEFRRNEVSEGVIVNTLVLAGAVHRSQNSGVRSLPEDPDTDTKGLNMAIYYV